MPRNETLVDAERARVWEVLADPELYVEWVVGTSDTTAADERWPQPGSKLQYEVGIGPLQIGDETTVIESDPPHRLVLRARAGAAATIRIEIVLEARDEKTAVCIQEDVCGGLAGILPDLITGLLFKARNVWSLERLRELAERSPVTAAPVAETTPALP